MSARRWIIKLVLPFAAACERGDAVDAGAARFFLRASNIINAARIPSTFLAIWH
jgi:hypothetical protein